MNLSMNNQIDFRASAALEEADRWGQWFYTQLELYRVSRNQDPQYAEELLCALERRGQTPQAIKLESFQRIRHTLPRTNVQLAISVACQLFRRVEHMYKIAGMEMPDWVSEEYRECDAFLESLK